VISAGMLPWNKKRPACINELRQISVDKNVAGKIILSHAGEISGHILGVSTRLHIKSNRYRTNNICTRVVSA
jgi:hypothetical protein